MACQGFTTLYVARLHLSKPSMSKLNSKFIHCLSYRRPLVSSLSSTPSYRHVQSDHSQVSKSRFDIRRQYSVSSEVQWEKPVGYDTGIKVWNTLTKQKDPLLLQHEKIGTWYLCGPTVYDSAHIGHGSTFMRFDILRRILTNFFDIDLTVVMGVTDIDYKIVKRGIETGIPFSHIAWTHEVEFFEDMAALNIQSPTITARVTEHVPQIIDYIRKLLDIGVAYTVPSGSVYFSIAKYRRYGKLSTSFVDTENTDDNDSEKKDLRDFALWKAAKPGEPHWPAPWGNGRPGWHIECSTMASGIFGSKIDLHAGGTDLIFPHHENEVAQSEAYHNCTQWVNYWLHAGHLHLKGDSNKMSKSLKNVVTISEFLDQYTSDQFRIFCLLTHYRNKIEYGEESMHKAVSINKQIISCLHQCDAYVRGQLLCQPINEARLRQSLSKARKNIEEVLADDFNTPAAMENVMEIIKQLNIALGKKTETSLGARSPAIIASISSYLQRVLQQLGMELGYDQVGLESKAQTQLGHVLDRVVKFRSQVRLFAIDPPEEITEATEKNRNTNAKEEKKVRRRLLSPLLQACDDIRDEMKSLNIQILDHGKESSWTIQDPQNDDQR